MDATVSNSDGKIFDEFRPDSSIEYDLPVGSELVVNCTLKDGPLYGTNISVNSSYLAFKKDGNSELYTGYTSILDNRTAQLRIPNAQVEDTGIYHCLIILPNELPKVRWICASGVGVGTPPKNVTNFKCISRNFDNLTCTWDVEPNGVQTHYSVRRKINGVPYFYDCPQLRSNTFCQWTDRTDPHYMPLGNLTFFVHGNNTFGSVRNVFKINHFEIVNPNEPVKLEVVDVNEHSVAVRWQSPRLSVYIYKPALYYQLRLDELGCGSGNNVVGEAGVDTFNYTFDGLIPHFHYKVSVRCRSNDAKEDDMWSPFASVIIKTNEVESTE